MNDAHRDTTAAAAAAVSEQLKRLFDEVARTEMDVADRARWQQRLIAGTNMAKRDVARAAEQLSRFEDEWNVVRRGKETRVDETDR